MNAFELDLAGEFALISLANTADLRVLVLGVSCTHVLAGVPNDLELDLAGSGFACLAEDLAGLIEAVIPLRLVLVAGMLQASLVAA